jgi:hypothetical protein
MSACIGNYTLFPRTADHVICHVTVTPKDAASYKRFCSKSKYRCMLKILHWFCKGPSCKHTNHYYYVEQRSGYCLHHGTSVGYHPIFFTALSFAVHAQRALVHAYTLGEWELCSTPIQAAHSQRVWSCRCGDLYQLVHIYLLNFIYRHE